ncbi:endonuclease V [Rhodamnia argentea]|uniref:Endonuclease V n=1 Tax=Rhodamnia argentea TaxID=178133 RepID=A0A8B8Q7V4_9MYRT|nr:endonuclease V [Rhodamnia argentea]XP_048133268.1 endonuclease V [Rhodamnia argentea]XP_048133269.1 endonuclease V [Rhodamnia argentea]XP_048133270.1 endonuclease V [Rhodamnia argentea]
MLRPWASRAPWNLPETCNVRASPSSISASFLSDRIPMEARASEEGEEAASSPAPSSSSAEVNQWIEAQNLLRRRLIERDDFPWKLPGGGAAESGDASGGEVLKYVGGVDMSFAKDDGSLACATLVVLDLSTLQVVYEDFDVVRLEVPYVPGFLAFREAPVLLELLEKVKRSAKDICPQLIMVDGNGLLHPRGFGLACHLGVLADLPTIGIGKNLHHVDGLTLSGVKQLLEAKDNFSKDLLTLTGSSGRTWGVAMRSTWNTSKPIFVSIGHRISLQTAVKVVGMTCKYRVPEPV